MSNEYVYPLNLPDVSEFIIDLEEYKKQLIVNRVADYNADMITNKYKNWMGIPWDVVLMFYKPHGFTPKVAHLDNDVPGFNNTWGINFHFGGSGLFEVYRQEDTTKIGDLNHGAARDCVINAKPYKSYFMPEGAYLAFTNLPHRVIGYQERFCISLRCESMYNRNPTEIVELFKDYIIDKPLLSMAPHSGIEPD